MAHVQHIQPVATMLASPVAPIPVAAPHQVVAYMATPAVPMETDVLQWWGAIGRLEYPQLAKLARQFLGCPASSASAERVFSLAGRVFGDHTQNMNPQTLEERMWAKCNRGKLEG
jgi:hypothetical protein